jgi:hypothetical protein
MAMLCRMEVSAIRIRTGRNRPAWRKWCMAES